MSLFGQALGVAIKTPCPVLDAWAECQPPAPEASFLLDSGGSSSDRAPATLVGDLG